MQTNIIRQRTQIAAVTNPRSGVALIICLGLLAIMTLLAVTFCIAMRVEREAARNFADGVRAQHMIRSSFVRAMEDIEVKLAKRIYPLQEVWTSVSTNGPSTPVRLISPEAYDLLPGDKIAPAVSNAIAEWIEITPNPYKARVAYVVVNTGGMLDISSVGTNPNVWSVDIKEIDFRSVPELSAAAKAAPRANIIAERDYFKRYETIDEIDALSSNFVSKVASFQTFSYDVNRDVVFFKTRDPSASPHARWWETAGSVADIDTNRPPAALGTREAEYYLGPKFNINSITQYTAYAAASNNLSAYLDSTIFMTEYFNPVRDMVSNAMPAALYGRPDDITWNLINYLDRDRLPHASKAASWLHSEGGEPVPLINELVIKDVNTPGGPGYEFHVELWYPFAPVKVVKEDDFHLQVMIFDKGSFTNNVTEMAITN
ncbi:MAG: hypothetical protein O2901_16025, partial [Verrucomicrobia bacterium]|nr:hypothetical protein [Verrucomicrobiota bacterium]